MEDYGSIQATKRGSARPLYTSLFQRPCLGRADRVLSAIMSPQTTFINILLSSLKLTTKERDSRESEDPCYERYVMLSLLIPALVILIILYLPVFGIAFIIWALIQRYRNPYRLRVCGQSNERRAVIGGLTVVSIDTRLLIEYKARWRENLGHTQKRAKAIGKGLVSNHSGNKTEGTSQEHSIIVDKESANIEQTEIEQSESTNRQIGNSIIHENIIFDIIEDFPKDAAIICLQGVFDTRAEKEIVRQLRQSYPYVISDAMKNSWKTNHFRFGSGLVMASKLPVSEVEFQCFVDTCGDDKNKSKGCLLVKINIGCDNSGRTRQLGIINTELQDGYGVDAMATRCKQMSQMSMWMKEHGDVPHVVCCNLHFDNASPDEKSNWSHPWFEDVIDPCALRPGEDLPGTIGTELKPHKIYKRAMSSPESMKRTLSTPEGRMEFVTEVQSSDTGGASGHTSGCRTNRILCRHGNNITLRVNKYSIVTQFAGLTTYLPLCAELSLEEPT